MTVSKMACPSTVEIPLQIIRVFLREIPRNLQKHFQRDTLHIYTSNLKRFTLFIGKKT